MVEGRSGGTYGAIQLYCSPKQLTAHYSEAAHLRGDNRYPGGLRLVTRAHSFFYSMRFSSLPTGNELSNFQFPAVSGDFLPTTVIQQMVGDAMRAAWFLLRRTASDREHWSQET